MSQTGPQSSDQDKMIELRYKLQNQSSSTVLCFSNFQEQLILIAIVDLKTRRKNIIKTLKVEKRPTFLFQIDEANILVGTEAGCIEHWNIEKEELVKIYDAHPGSEQGISSIIEIKSQSELLWNDATRTETTRMIATASFGNPEYRIMLLQLEANGNYTLSNHLKIKTSLPGIAYLLEASENVIVAVDTFKTLKFYEFVDRQKQEEEEERKKKEEEMTNAIKILFKRYDKDRSGYLSLEEFGQVIEQYCIELKIETETFNAYIDLWKSSIILGADQDQDNRISTFEIRDLVRGFLDSNLLNLK